MFYFLLPTLLTYNLILIAAAVIPAIFLMIKVYRSDRLEKESSSVLWNLVKAGIFASLIALVEEKILSWILNSMLPQDEVLYNVILYFGIVAFAEESSKYLMLKRNSWNSRDFNCQYDAVVYALFVSLGFALWENISYVMAYGLGTALVRAVTAIPGHACFGVFMGVFYGFAKRFEKDGMYQEARTMQIFSVVVPAILHGIYDYIASSDAGTGWFIGFVAVLFIVSYYLVGKMARNDRYL